MFGANIIYSSVLKWQRNKVHTGVILSLERLFVCDPAAVELWVTTVHQQSRFELWVLPGGVTVDCVAHKQVINCHCLQF